MKHEQAGRCQEAYSETGGPCQMYECGVCLSADGGAWSGNVFPKQSTLQQGGTTVTSFPIETNIHTSAGTRSHTHVYTNLSCNKTGGPYHVCLRIGHRQAAGLGWGIHCPSKQGDYYRDPRACSDKLATAQECFRALNHTQTTAH